MLVLSLPVAVEQELVDVASSARNLLSARGAHLGCCVRHQLVAGLSRRLSVGRGGQAVPAAAHPSSVFHPRTAVEPLLVSVPPSFASCFDCCALYSSWGITVLP